MVSFIHSGRETRNQNVSGGNQLDGWQLITLSQKIFQHLFMVIQKKLLQIANTDIYNGYPKLKFKFKKLFGFGVADVLYVVLSRWSNIAKL